MEISLQGRISSGLGEGKYFTQLDWFVEQVVNKLGFVPFPGTLNVDISEGDREALARFRQDGWLLIEPVDKAFCSAACYELLINHTIKGAVVMPEKTEHPPERLEVIAPLSIKQALKLADGDSITLTIRK